MAGRTGYPSPRANSVDDDLWTTLWGVVSLLLHRSQRTARSMSLTLPQCLVLRIVSERGAIPSTILARELGVTLPTITSVADHLVGEGLVRRDRSLSDRRQVILQLTAKGKRQLSRFRRNQEKLRQEIVEQLTVSDRRRLTNILGRLQGRLRIPGGPFAVPPSGARGE